MFSSDADILIVLDSFDLEQCCQHSEPRSDVTALHTALLPPHQKLVNGTASLKHGTAIEETALLPLPQKFVDGTARQGNTMARSNTVFLKRVACRAIGETIVCDESAHWTCKSDERERAVRGAASLITAFVDTK
jgi:hypothetical protein